MWTHCCLSLPDVGEIAGSLLPLLPSVTTSSAVDVPDHLAHQLHTIRATISHLTHLRSSSSSSSTVPPLELLLYARIAPIASACSNHPDILHLYMNFTPFAACPHEDARTSSPAQSVLDLPLTELLNLATSTSAVPIRLCLDIGGGMGTLAGVLQVGTSGSRE